VTLTCVRGDATSPHGAGPKIITHVCNDVGRWGKGFVLALSRRWSQPEEAFRAWAKDDSGDYALGAVQFVEVESRLWVANLVGQHGLRAGRSGVPIRYEAVEQGLEKVAEKALELRRRSTCRGSAVGWPVVGGNWSNRSCRTCRPRHRRDRV
jgi:O-acetyl-ADP-ribose deacetylase (regulator of RNase III)